MLRSGALVSISLLVFLSGCGGGSGSSSATNSSIVVTTSLAKADVNAGANFTLQSYVTGDIKSGGLTMSLSGAGTISTTGPDFFGTYSTLYTAPGSPIAVNPTSLVGTSASITVASKTDGSRNVVVPITLHDNIQFPPQVLPDALAGKPYTFTFTATGGTGTLKYVLLSTSAPLPPGLALSNAGVLSGSPTTVGTYNFQILVTDQATNVIGFARAVTLQVS